LHRASSPQMVLACRSDGPTLRCRTVPVPPAAIGRGLWWSSEQIFEGSGPDRRCRSTAPMVSVRVPIHGIAPKRDSRLYAAPSTSFRVLKIPKVAWSQASYDRS
jgi:hypothetical protein